MEDVATQEIPPQEPEVKTHFMDSKILIIIAALILLVLLVGGFYLYRNLGVNTKNQATTTNNLKTPQGPTPTDESQSNINSTSTTDSQLELDMQKVNSDYDSLNNDVTNVDQGLNDKQTNLQ